MFKISRLMLVGMLWVGACVQAAEAEPTVEPVAKSASSLVTGFTRADVTFVLNAYDKYQEQVAGYEKQADQQCTEYNKKGFVGRFFSKKVDNDSLIDKALIDYCNTLLSRFYRSQLDEMAKAAPVKFTELKKAIEVACKSIDIMGEVFVSLVHINNIDKIKQYINHLRKNHTLQIALNAVDKFGYTAFFWACYRGDANIVKELLSAKDALGNPLVDVNVVDQFGNTALLWTCREDKLEIVKELLSAKDASGNPLVDVNAKDRHGNTAFFWASKGDANIVKELLSAKDALGNPLVDVNAKDKGGHTAFWLACYRGDANIVKELLNAKDALGNPLVDVNLVDNLGDTVFMKACKDKDLEIVKELLSAKDILGKALINVNAVYPTGDTELIKACTSNSFSVVQLLLEYGANILHANNSGKSALSILHQKLTDAAISDADKVKIKSILKVFDALRLDVTDATLKGMLPEARVLKDAYVKFQEGKHQELRNVLFEMPLVYESKGQGDYSTRMAMAMLEIFKPECVRPLITFLQPRGAKQKAVAQVYLGEAQDALNFQAKAAPKASVDTVIDMNAVD